MKPLKEKKPFQAPHTFVILVVLILLAVAATYVVPAGEYTRYTDEATNRTLVEAGSFHYVESHPVSFLTVPALIYRAIVKAASTVTFILIIGGSFEIITSTGILTVLCKKMAKAFRGREYFVIPAFLLLFSVFGTTMGMSAEVMIFVPIGIALAASLGLDKVTGTAMIAMGAASGFTAGILNPFNVGVAQDIAEIPMFSGMGYRIFILGVLLVIDTVYITWYAKRVKADPTKSIIYGEPEDQEFTFDDTEEALNLTHGLTLAVIVAGFAVLIYGLSKLGWYFEEMSAIFIAMGVLCGIVNRYSPNKIAATFGNGAKGIVVGALIVGIARGVELALSDAMILDTIVHAIASIVNILPQSLKAVGMFLAQSLVNCVITSGTGQAAVTMPLMVPVADLIGITRQTAVLAFQLGDGFSNSVLPTSSALMGYLVVSKIPYVKWLKFMMPLFLIWTFFGCLFMLGALIESAINRRLGNNGTDNGNRGKILMEVKERLKNIWSTLCSFDKLSGEPEAYRAVEYILEVLEKSGISCHEEDFPAYLSNPVSSVLIADGEEFPCRPRSFSESTKGRIEIPLIYDPGTKTEVSLSEQKQFMETVAGKLVLGYGFDERYAKLLEQHGAAGWIQIWTSDEDAVHEDTVSPVWGTPDMDSSLFQLTDAGGRPSSMALNGEYLIQKLENA
ncbi:MAG: YfcC family protein [Clostridiaceae bacterium]